MSISDLLVRPPLRGEDLGTLRAALAGAATPAEGEAPPSVTIGVSGGAPSERYQLMVRLNGAGEGEFRFLDELRDRTAHQRGFTVSADDTARIFGLLQPLVEPRPRQLYDPDSLVGFVTVRAGELETQTTFPVREAGDDDLPDNLVALMATDDGLHVDPDDIPEGLTDLFAAMTSLVRQEQSRT